MSTTTFINSAPVELKNFYQSLEDLKSVSIWKIFDTINFSENIDGEWETKLITERKVLCYSLNKGKMVSSTISFDVKGKPIPIEFTDEEIEYLRNRLDTTENSFLLAKYSHILWQITKHNHYAEIALENYLRLTPQMKQDDRHQMPNVLDATILISQKTKKRRTDVIEIIEVLFKEGGNGLRARFMRTILDSNYLKRNELLKIGKSIPCWIEIKKITSYFTNQEILQLGLDIYHKTGLDKKPLYSLLAENEDLIIEANSEDSSFVKLEYVSKKAYYLQRAGREKESEKCFEEVTRLKTTIEMAKISVEMGSKELGVFNSLINSMCTQLLGHSPNEILNYFAANQNLLVDYAEVTKEAEERLANSLFNLCTVTTFDNNNNFKNLDEKEKLKREVVNSYTFRNLYLELLFSKVLVNGILQGKLNFYTVHEFLEKETWFGTKFHRKLGAENIDLKSSWISLLSPGLHSLFAQFTMGTLLKDNKINNFILAIDSLTLKFEGALRDFILLTGGNTTKFKDDKQQEEVLEELLNNKKTQELFTERDIHLFKYTFTKNGKNLRNNVAHSFLNFSQYNFQPAALIFLCILRLGKYTLCQKK